MQINLRETVIFLACVATVVLTNMELLNHFGPKAKDTVTLAAMIIIAVNNKIVEKR